MSDAMSAVKDDIRPYLDAFRDNAAEPQWLRDIRREALASFGERGFPSRRDEAWRFTNLRALTASYFPPGSPPRRKPESMVEVDTGLRRYGMKGESHRLVFVGGRFSREHSNIGVLPEGVWLASMAETLATRPDLARRALDPSDTAGGQPFAALNAALFADGVVLALEPHARLTHPVEIHYLGQSEVSESRHPRNLIVAGEGAVATVIETVAQTGPVWTNAVTQVVVGTGASLKHIRIQDDVPDAIHLALTRAKLEHSAIYANFTLTTGAELSRQDVIATFEGEQGCLYLDGAYLLRGDQDATMSMFVDHVAPDCKTRELWKGVLDDRAHGAFLGRIAVRPDAQKTDAQQVSRAMLLSDRAAVDTKPELEILADDVKCAHGAAVGDLDQDMLFYLRARGIDADAARRMLIEAFVLDAIDRVEDASLRAHLADHVRSWLQDDRAAFETHAARAPQDEEHS